MDANLAVIGSEYFVLGFQLAGVKRSFIVSKETVSATLENVLGQKDIGIVIMQHDDFMAASPRLQERALTQVRPTVVVLSHDTSAEENLRIMIKRSLGIDLWARKENV